ncbi:MAG: HAMP domain-containing protein [Methyloprofundus sp.]|nr:HAMP domain-containing protein [Methyloprofundus sp.]
MNWFQRPKSLSLKTSITLAFGLIIYTGLSIGLVLYFVLIPMSDRAADDMAAFISMVSESWVSLNEQERMQFQTHLREDHQLFISTDPVPVTAIKKNYPFIPRLEKALLLHTGQQLEIKQHLEGPCCFWVNIMQNGQVVRIGFYHERIGPKPPMALAGIIASACLLILITTILLVRRITRPVRKLSAAANRLGRGDFSIRIPETGAKELVSLAHCFNRMAEELSQLMSNRAILFGGISHDLRTPITRMQIALELLEDNNNSSLIAGLRNDLKEMERLIQQALELVKGLDKSKPVETDLKQLIATIVADYQRQKQTINWQVSQCGTCMIEVDTLHRVLTNLLDNAFCYGGDEPVDLSCIRKGKNLIIRIKDQGPGIPKEQLEAVFQPFFRLDSSRSKKTGGSGLGLAIVRQLCDVHSWKVQLFPGKGKGLEACLIIPVVVP